MTKTYLNTTPQLTTVACLSCGAQCDPSGFSVPVTSLKEETSLKLNLGLLAKPLWTIQESRGSEPHGNSKYTSETVRSKGVGSNKRLQEEPKSMVHPLQGKMKNMNLAKGRSRTVLGGTCPCWSLLPFCCGFPLTQPDTVNSLLYYLLSLPPCFSQSLSVFPLSISTFSPPFPPNPPILPSLLPALLLSTETLFSTLPCYKAKIMVLRAEISP